jgi:hypothetical protein
MRKMRIAVTNQSWSATACLPTISQGCHSLIQPCQPTPVSQDVGPGAASMRTLSSPDRLGSLISNLPLAQLSWMDSLLPPQEITVHLVEVYFESVQPQFRLLHRPSFLQRLHSGSLERERYSSLVLNAIFALATKYTDDPRVYLFDGSLMGGPPYGGSLCNARVKRMKPRERGQGFMRRASELVQNEILKAERLKLESGTADESSLSLIQAIALLSYAELAMGATDRAHSLVSTCVRMAYDAGLDQVDRVEYLRLLNVSTNAPYCLQDIHRMEKEELRHAWWCIWELDSFVCSIRCQPRMINSLRCRTKLPVDDVDWFEGKEVPSSFLPRGLDQWHKLWNTSHCTSVLANRIVSLHFSLALVDLANDEDLEELFGSYSEIEQCASIWKNSLPAEFKPESRLQHILQQSDSLSEVFPMYICSEVWVGDLIIRL